jgi:hypothetical protein
MYNVHAGTNLLEFKVKIIFMLRPPIRHNCRIYGGEKTIHHKYEEVSIIFETGAAICTAVVVARCNRSISIS